MKRFSYLFSILLRGLTGTSANEMTSGLDGNSATVRLLDCQGLDARKNDILYHPPSDIGGGRVVFFGGDVQDYPEKMLKHRDNRHHVKWNLEYVSGLLHNIFPTSEIYIVKPSRMHLNTFSCYDNFVKGNDVGAPRHSEDLDSLKHLKLLIESARTKLLAGKDENKEQCPSTTTLVPLVIIGFSKGCVVLNQFIYSLKAVQECGDPKLQQFSQTIKTMYWLEGGHPGGSNTWITNKSLLQCFAKTGIEVHIHVTPYQMNCSLRPWIGKEEKAFREALKKFGAKVEREMHFEDEEHSLENHFRVLEAFHSVRK